MKKGAKKKPSSDRTILIATTLIVTLVAISPLLFSLATPIFFSGGFIVGEPPECSDGLDNDLDGASDIPPDGKCTALCDDEQTECELDEHCDGIGSGTCNLVCDDVCAIKGNDLWDDECPNGRVIFRLSSKLNAHVGRDRDNPQVAYYPYSICRQFTQNTAQTCDGSNLVLRLSSQDDAHVEKNTANAYEGTGFDVCYGNFECVYGTTCDEANGFECIATIAPSDQDNPDTNMMVSSTCEGAGAFDQKICCRDHSLFSASSDIINDLDEDPGLEGQQIPQGLTHTLFFEEQAIDGNVVDCEWSVSENGGSFTTVDKCNGANPTVPDQVITFDAPVGTTYRYKLTVETDVETKSTTADLMEIIPAAVCGNGIPEKFGDIGGPQYEGCDDGNLVAGDGCSSTCQPELGYKCSVHRPSVCSPICGDGYLVANELNPNRCDDGKSCNDGSSCTSHLDCLPAQGDCRTRNNDGCDTACYVEPNWECTTDIPTDPPVFDTRNNNNRLTGRAADTGPSVNKNKNKVTEPTPLPLGPSICTGICGDGIFVGQEQCEFRWQCNINDLPCNPDDESTCFGGTCEYVTVGQSGEALNSDDELVCADISHPTLPGNFNQGTISCNPASSENKCQLNIDMCAYCGDNFCHASEMVCPNTCAQDCGNQPGFPDTCFSFLPGTQVTLADKTTKNIEDITLKDKVLGYNEQTSFTEPSEVTHLINHPADEYYIINERIKVTPTNPIYVNEKWILPPNIKIGDRLMNSDKGVELVHSIELEFEDVTVYTLTVHNTNNFFVENILAHNKHCGIGPGFCEALNKDACENNECCHFEKDIFTPSDGTCVPDIEI